MLLCSYIKDSCAIQLTILTESVICLCTGVRFKRRTILMVICGIWLYATLWALFPLLGWGSYGPEPFGLACSIDWTGYGESLNHATFIMTLSILCTFLPCLAIVFTYFGIAWKLHRAYQSIQSNDFQYGNIEKKITLVSKKRSMLQPVSLEFNLKQWMCVCVLNCRTLCLYTYPKNKMITQHVLNWCKKTIHIEKQRKRRSD